MKITILKKIYIYSIYQFKLKLMLLIFFSIEKMEKELVFESNKFPLENAQIKSLSLINQNASMIEHFFDLVTKTSDEQFREERVNHVAIQRWVSNPEVRLIFNNFEKFREFVKNKNDEIYPQSIEVLRDRFLHKKMAL